MPQGRMLHILAQLKKVEDSPPQKNKTEVEAQLKRHELREAKERESNGNGLNKVDICVLLEELKGQLEMMTKWHFCQKAEKN
jgi:hypothetical protein